MERDHMTVFELIKVIEVLEKKIDKLEKVNKLMMATHNRIAKENAKM
jgi:hypothetical protein